MKSIILVATLLISTSAFSRQYIQCSLPDVEATDVAVVNLPAKNSGTLFISSGVQNSEDERILVNIEFDRIEDEKHFYKVVNQQSEGYVSIPNDVIEKNSNSFSMDLFFAGYGFEFKCFSRIYNDE